MATQKSKVWYQSSTIWLNLIGLSVIGLQMIAKSELLDAEWQALILAILNLLNRLRTKEAVRLI